MKKIVISPLTRLNNSSSVEVTVENNKVVDAKCSTIFFRGFEIILRGRDPRDAPYLTGRICGICSDAHSQAASLALEDAAGLQPPPNGRILRNLILGASFLQNHIRHFYLHSLMDFVQWPQEGLFAPAYRRDYRLPQNTNEELVRHYFKSVEISRLGYELITLLGGKAPHTHGMLAGGGTVNPTADILMNFRGRLKQINDFITHTMLPDSLLLARYYPDYYEIGSRSANFLEFGVFPQDNGALKSFPGTAVLNGKAQELDASLIKEHISKSWYAGDENSHPFRGRTEPDLNKEDAYSWAKAPRYAGKAVEGGPLARLWILGTYRRGISTMDRIIARVLEAQMIGNMMEEWIEQLEPGKPLFTPFETPQEAEGAGLTGAMRGPLGHWLRIEKGRIAHYEIITPTAWNFSPRDDSGQLGPIEEALIGTPVEDEKEPVEIGRVIRAFDVCSSCSAHVITRGSPVREITIIP